MGTLCIISACLLASSLAYTVRKRDLPMGCNFQGNVYADGERFTDANGNSCTCNNGGIGCVGQPLINCNFQGNYYGDGERFIDSNGNSCQCRQGSIGCVGKPLEPQYPPCDYNGLAVPDGKQIFDRESQSVCTCQQGEFSCAPAE